MNQSITTEVKTHKITFKDDDVFYVTKKDAKEFEERQITDKYGWYTMIRDGYEFQRQPGYGCIEELPRKQLFKYLCGYGTWHEGESECKCYYEFNKKTEWRFEQFIDSVKRDDGKYVEAARQFKSKFPNFINENKEFYYYHERLLSKIDTKVKKEIAQVL